MNFIRVCDHTILTNFLMKQPLILDCGANKGEFSAYFSEEFGAHVFGFEPDPRLFSELPSHPNIKFFQVAVTGIGNKFTLKLGELNCSSGYFKEETDQQTIEVDSIQLENFCLERGINKIDLIKLDIEGAEIDVLQKASDEFLLKTDQITVEFHDFLMGDQLILIKKVVKKMRNLGFYYAKISFFDHSNVIFINTKLHKFNSFDVLYITLFKYISGLKRLLLRLSKEKNN